LTLGFYENFPPNIHRIDRYNYSLSNKRVQIKLVSVLKDNNGKEFSFEQVANPTVPNGCLIFEFGLAESGDFNYIDEEELKKTKDFLSKKRLHSLDFFCSIRYYKCNDGKRSALKFDYYMLRFLFKKETLEIQVFHERGPRYISPEELTEFIYIAVNSDSTKNKKTLKRIET